MGLEDLFSDPDAELSSQEVETLKVWQSSTEYVVEYIYAHTVDDNGIMWYRVHWDGYEDSENSWEPAVELQRNCQVLISEYHRNA